MRLWQSLRQVAEQTLRRAASEDAPGDAPEEGTDDFFEDEHKTEPFPTEPSVPTGGLQAMSEEQTYPDLDALAQPTVLTPPSLDEAVCRATVKPYLELVNVRAGPGLNFPRIERTLGAETFGLAALSASDESGFAWGWIVWEDGSGWVRADLLDLAGDIPRPEPAGSPVPLTFEPSGDRWPLPVPGRIVQDYHGYHPAYDLAAPLGAIIRASAAGVIIRRLAADHCAAPPGHVRPESLTPEARAAVFSSPGWGFGYGNLVIVRHDYVVLPASLRQYMENLGLSGGFAYLLYAHLDRLDVESGQRVAAGEVIGAAGQTGHTAGPGLHLEVRVGLAEQINGAWAEQAVLPPALLFAAGPAHQA